MNEDLNELQQAELDKVWEAKRYLKLAIASLEEKVSHYDYSRAIDNIQSAIEHIESEWTLEEGEW